MADGSDLERKFDALRKKQCATKTRYDSEADAEVAAKAANVPYAAAGVTVYKCPWCPGWHIGKASQKR